MVKPRVPIERRTHERVREGDLNKPLTFQFWKDKTFSKRWETELYGAVKAVQGRQIGGQMPSAGPDVLQHIKSYDPDNSSGSVKDAVDIMLKLQNSTEQKSLFTSIQPLQSILGGGLYGKMSSAGSSAKTQHKKQRQKKEKQEEGQEAPQTADIIDQLIAAAMAMLTPEDAELVAELLDSAEISRIENAYYNRGTYTSSTMPQTFVTAINTLMPTFRATVGVV